MKECRLLYQIKDLEKLIVRLFICNDLNDGIVPLAPTQMQIIEYILEHPNENIYQKDLENILSLRRATVSGVLQTMEKNHLIERVIDTNDSRIKKIILNPEAKNIFLMHMKKMEEIEEYIVKGITEEEITYFLKVISKMKNNLKLVVDNRKELEDVKINKEF